MYSLRKSWDICRKFFKINLDGDMDVQIGLDPSLKGSPHTVNNNDNNNNYYNYNDNGSFAVLAMFELYLPASLNWKITQHR